MFRNKNGFFFHGKIHFQILIKDQQYRLMKQTKLYWMRIFKTHSVLIIKQFKLRDKAAKSCVKYIPFWPNKLIKNIYGKIREKHFPRYFSRRNFLYQKMFFEMEHTIHKRKNQNVKRWNAHNRQNKYYF